MRKEGLIAVGLYVDGLFLKYVRLSLESGHVLVQECRTAKLIEKIEERTNHGREEGVPQNIVYEDALRAAEKEQSNAQVLLELLSTPPPKNQSISLALSEPVISYHEFESDFNLQGLKLKKKLALELSALRGDSPPLDSFQAITTASGGLLAIVRQGGLQLFDLINEAHALGNGHVANVKGFHSADVALIELVRAGYTLAKDEITALVYVGYEFTRIILMRGSEHLMLAPVVSEGFDSPHIDKTIYSRIKLEQENLGIGKIDRVLLAGEGHRKNLLRFVKAQFPNSSVDYLEAPELRLTFSDAKNAAMVSEYAIPLSVARQALEPPMRGTYDANLIPLSITESQRAFSLAWHGWIAIALIGLTLLVFMATIIPQRLEINAAREEFRQNPDEVATLQQYKMRKGTLVTEMNRFEEVMNLYNSLVRGSDRWTRILTTLGNTLNDVKSIWIYSIRPVAGNPSAFDIKGAAVERGKVSELFNSFAKASLLQMRTVAVQNRNVFEFDIRIEKIDNDDIPYVPSRTGKR